MNSTILKKAIDELQKASPKIEYVLGMLETLYEMQEPTKPTVSVAPLILPSMVASSAPIDEASILDAQARAAIETVNTMTKLE